MLQGVAQHALAIGDLGRVGEAGEQADLGHLEEEVVARRHRGKERLQLQILGEGLGVRWKLLAQIEVPVAVHQERLHRLTRSRKRL